MNPHTRARGLELNESGRSRFRVGIYDYTTLVRAIANLGPVRKPQNRVVYCTEYVGAVSSAIITHCVAAARTSHYKTAPDDDNLFSPLMTKKRDTLYFLRPHNSYTNRELF